MKTSVALDNINRLAEGKHENPAEVLGPHEVLDGSRRALAVRAWLPHGKQAWVLDAAHQDSPRPMRRIHPSGLFEAICPMRTDRSPSDYQLRVTDQHGNENIMHDPYAFLPVLTDYDRYLLNEGTHWQSYDKLGAHARTVDGVQGMNFVVWAPNANGVSLIGDFNSWDARRHPMRKHIPSGFWELFVPGMGPKQIYKYRIQHAGGVLDKADPYGFAAELPPRTASLTWDLESYQWSDAEYMSKLQENNRLDAPHSVYEIHLGSWRRPDDPNRIWLNYRDLAHQLVEYIQQLGFTHIELLPVTEHPFTGSWGYQTTGYYAPTSRYGTPDDFMYFVDYCHRHGIGVILDWVPAHFPRDDHGLRLFDGTALYEHADPRQGEHRDWGTLIFNYGRHEVANFLLSNALFWLDKYHIDGLRVDAVASMIYLDYSRDSGDWIPNQFGGRENLEAIQLIKQFNEQVHLQHPGVLTIAEESTAWPGVSRPTYLGGLGFSLKWNMGWMNDTLSYMEHEAIHRRFHHDELTFSLIYAFHENFVLPLSHDEVVHGKGSLLDKMPGDEWQRFANLRLLYTYMWTHPGKKLLFMGGEIGQWNEWDADGCLQWDLLQWDPHQGIQRLVGDLNRLYRTEKALHEVDFDGAGFQWIDCHNYDESTLSYLRIGKRPEDVVLSCLNFTPVVRKRYRVGVPHPGAYAEIFNSDSEYYAGTNVGNGSGIVADAFPSHGCPYSVELTLPPLAGLVLKPLRPESSAS